MKYAIFDLDNCLADDRDRIQLIDWSKASPSERYAAYHAACGKDPVRNKEIFNLRTKTEGLTPIFLTARPVKVWAETVDWIGLHFGTLRCILIMRNNDDERPSVVVKADQLGQLRDYYSIVAKDIAVAYDDRDDIVQMYKSHGINGKQLKIHDVCAYNAPSAPQATQPTEAASKVKPSDAASILADMAKTFSGRSAVYQDNYKMVAPLVKALFPAGVPPELVVTDQWHLFELKLVKLSRFAVSGLTHQDSIHDDAVYSAMIEAILKNKEANNG